MKLDLTVVAGLVAASFAGYGCSSSTSEAPDASAPLPTQDSAAPPVAVSDSGGGGPSLDSSSDANGLGDATSTPIGWADAWVAGFYGTAYRGTNTYSNTDTAGFPSGYYTQWRGDPGATLFANVTDCSSFSDILMMRSYGWIPATTGLRPHADDYYWAIRNAQGFAEIANVNDIQVGDVIALLYPPGASNSGHVAWIDALPASFSGAPAESGLSGFVVTVIDSTDGFHDGASGPSTTADDRFLGYLAGGAQCTSDAQCTALYGSNAVCNSTTLTSVSVCSYVGVGRGQMRLFADSAGNIQGHTWSPNAFSTYEPRPSPLPTKGGAFTGEDIVVGRYSGG